MLHMEDSLQLVFYVPLQIVKIVMEIVQFVLHVMLDITSTMVNAMPVNQIAHPAYQILNVQLAATVSTFKTTEDAKHYRQIVLVSIIQLFHLLLVLARDVSMVTYCWMEIAILVDYHFSM